MADIFSTVPDEQLHIAMGMMAYLDMHGYQIAVEEQELEYPRTPTLVGRRGHSTLFIEVGDKFDSAIARSWARYGRSCDRDVQIGIAIPNDPGASQGDMENAQAERVGLFTADRFGGIGEIVAPVDIALHVELPELKTLPPSVRPIAAPFYRKFEKGDWRDGFADACLAVEEIAREYLKERSQIPGVSILDSRGRPITLTEEKIESSTLGQLSVYFLGITTPNAKDSILAKVLPNINKERILAVHKKYTGKAESILRVAAGRKMYAILNCLIELS